MPIVGNATMGIIEVTYSGNASVTQKTAIIKRIYMHR